MSNGVFALLSNTTGNSNTAIGVSALSSNTTGEFNNAVGANSLLSNVDGSSNNAFGESALFNNTSGNQNTAIGDLALQENTTGNAVTLHRVAAFCLRAQARVLPDHERSVGIDCALHLAIDAQLSPAGFFASCGPAIAESTERGKERKDHESIDSAQNNSTSSHHTGAPLLRAFADNASGHPAAGRRLRRREHGGGH